MLADLLVGLPGPLVVLAIGLLVVAEAALVVGVVLPGSSALLTLGVFADSGLVALPVALAVGTVAALVGSNLSFAAGRYRPGALSSRWLTSAKGQRARAVLGRYGGSAVLVGQWVVGARTLTPRFAAAAGLSYRRFLPWNLPSAAIWGLVWVAVGYGASEAYQRWSWLAVVVGVVLIGGLLLVGRRALDRVDAVEQA
ncbi:DedA family protein [Kutzneria chonburiensis]|uniref:DedA family protein n=1 Tax=Kutzneria chonburiensis TaxID=1483604 RepID=A0ABV6MYG9_9PSEU|nr:DedA family protein [Kutzneria chonburiensis]